MVRVPIEAKPQIAGVQRNHLYPVIASRSEAIWGGGGHPGAATPLRARRRPHPRLPRRTLLAMTGRWCAVPHYGAGKRGVQRGAPLPRHCEPQRSNLGRRGASINGFPLARTSAAAAPPQIATSQAPRKDGARWMVRSPLSSAKLRSAEESRGVQRPLAGGIGGCASINYFSLLPPSFKEGGQGDGPSRYLSTAYRAWISIW